MHQNSTLLYYYTLNGNQEECGIQDLKEDSLAFKPGYTEVYDYLDSLYVEAPESIVRLILEKI